MRNEFSIEELVADLRPVRRRSPWRDAALLVGVAVVELAVFHLLGFRRPDFAQAMHGASLSWKLGNLLLIALVAVATAFRSLAPERSPRVGLRGVAAAVVLALLAGIALGELPSSLADAARRLDWRDGLACVKDMLLLSIPPAVAFALPRGAARPPTSVAPRWRPGCGRPGGAPRVRLRVPVRRPALHRGLVSGGLRFHGVGRAAGHCARRALVTGRS